jgi:hypothetical protein
MTWKKPPSRHAGPWWRDGRCPVARWARTDGAPLPSVGGGALQRAYGDRREQAYRDMCAKVSVAYLKNRRPFVPGS